LEHVAVQVSTEFPASLEKTRLLTCLPILLEPGRITCNVLLLLLALLLLLTLEELVEELELCGRHCGEQGQVPHRNHFGICLKNNSQVHGLHSTICVETSSWERVGGNTGRCDRLWSKPRQAGSQPRPTPQSALATSRPRSTATSTVAIAHRRSYCS